MASVSPTFTELNQQIRKGVLAPAYILHGEEGFFIDELVKAFDS